MSHDSADDLKGTIERRTFLQLAGGVALAGATQWASTAAAAPSKAYVPGASTREYDKMFVASVTPYKPGTEDIDEVAFRNYMRYWAQPKFVGAGGAMLASPEAGEAFYLTQAEKLRLAEIALEELGDKTVVFSGVMQTTTRACIEEARALKKLGVHGLFLMPPIGTIDIVAAWDSKKNPEVWIDQLKEIADAVNLPVIIHPTGGKFFSLPLESGMKTVDAVPQIVGYKMITEDFEAMARALRDDRVDRLLHRVVPRAADGTVEPTVLDCGRHIAGAGRQDRDVALCVRAQRSRHVVEILGDHLVADDLRHCVDRLHAGLERQREELAARRVDDDGQIHGVGDIFQLIDPNFGVLLRIPGGDDVDRADRRHQEQAVHAELLQRARLLDAGARRRLHDAAEDDCLVAELLERDLC